ncbi:TonB-dependent receptor plug domain-containing protein [Teredinibacter sp. KSP-S5-2]|uniref:TonB-dependent receptor plug domain-containing protein n=1 Tax=Teredinibacter sp. KSP-S5-2 TaxID=3034506 RepID=UPI002934E032|nr:TonB-dependent receptor plug domain-containing protein [Teredinibacter sp. KSP-S5-2]WNO07933.1 TonB-dependent receptor plug domain-containing protein [Teredinibacter sp. KSP-S5-2]
MFKLCFISLLFVIPYSSIVHAQDEQLFSMTLAELAKIRIISSGALTATEEEKIPATITTIDREMIDASGARSLDELLEYYVPNLLTLQHHGSGQHIGLRGIISDLDNKILLLVNGRLMNHKSVFGAFTERFMSMLGDIDHINVITGPGSALYGPGALAGVIDIHTQDSRVYKGADINLRRGFEEEFTALEMRYGHDFGSDHGIYVYYGVDDYTGAQGDLSEGYISKAGSYNNGTTWSAGYFDDLPNYHGSDFARHKFHLDYDKGDFSFFSRYTRGGVRYRNPYFFELDHWQHYQQLTTQADYEHKMSDELSLELSAGWDSTHVERSVTGDIPHFSFSEEEFKLKMLAQWTPVIEHSLALGGEYSREDFARDSLGIATDFSHASVNGPKRDPWTTDTYSLVGEYQWRASDKWSVFVGGRGDKHTWSNWLFSPKAAVIWSPSKKQSVKLIYNESVRKIDDEPLEALIRSDAVDNAEKEEIKSLELKHEYNFSKPLKTGYTVFYYTYDIIAWTRATLRESPIGTIDAYGLELELNYSDENHDLGLFHSYTQLQSFNLLDNTLIDQAISTEPYGYGNDFHNWSPHITKLHWLWRLTNKTKVNTSLQVFWGFPGAEDYAQYNVDNLGRGGISGRTISDGRTKAFGASAYLHTGLDYVINERATAKIKFYNLLGLIDKDLNKRNRYYQMGQFRNEVPAVSLGVELGF